MRWTPGGESSDIEDQRGSSGGGGGLLGGRSLGIFGTLAVLVLSLVFHQNFFALLGGGGGGGGADTSQQTSNTPAPPASESPAEHKQVQLVSVVIDDVQASWASVLPKSGAQYEKAKLVLYRDGVRSACGFAQSAVGPFYCPVDRKVYLDLGFFDELRTRFGAPGEFAEAYVIAHEFGHHIQNLLGTEARVRQAREAHPDQGNALSVRLELQADCFAGVWGNSARQRGILEKGDVENGLRAAASVGDDRLQKQATGHVRPETFTHGSSQQRTEWFQRGFQSGDISACDTFRSSR